MFIVGSLAQAVEELVHNAVDAGSRSVAVVIDAAAGAASCADDGCGVPLPQLRLLGQRHHTSKLRSLSELEAGVPTLGFRGEALASLADCAVVELVTRAEGSFDTGAVVLTGGALVSCGLSPTPRKRGTTVTLRSFLYNKPVRRAALDAGAEMEACRERLLRVALARPELRITLDAGGGRRLLDCAAGRTLAGTYAAAFGALLPPAAMPLAPLEAADGPMLLSGLVGVPPVGAARTAEAGVLFLHGLALRRGGASPCVRAAPERPARLRGRDVRARQDGGGVQRRSGGAGTAGHCALRRVATGGCRSHRALRCAARCSYGRRRLGLGSSCSGAAASAGLAAAAAAGVGHSRQAPCGCCACGRRLRGRVPVPARHAAGFVAAPQGRAQRRRRSGRLACILCSRSLCTSARRC
jgi:hypothetical protein